METNHAVDALAALAQETRLTAFRLLVEAGPEGIAAGEIARTLDVPPPNLSFHLSALVHAGLVTSRRDGRQVIYAADFDAMDTLVGFLAQNCCRGEGGCLPSLERTGCAPKARAGKA
jgi:ArsR family transcriptional regulator, arsenate/arsenite/antimonite-responsive transcriptional repressor